MNNPFERLQGLREQIGRTKERAVSVNEAFAAEIGPKGGLDFTHERYVTTGDGYEACLTIFGYPKTVGDYWLTLLTGIEGTMCKLDLSCTNQAQVKLNLRKALDAYDRRR